MRVSVSETYMVVKFSEYFGKLCARASLLHKGRVFYIKNSSYVKFHSCENLPLKQFAFSFRADFISVFFFYKPYLRMVHTQ